MMLYRCPDVQQLAFRMENENFVGGGFHKQGVAHMDPNITQSTFQVLLIRDPTKLTAGFTVDG